MVAFTISEPESEMESPEQIREEPDTPVGSNDTVTEPEAPWGRRKDGTPRKRPGRKPGSPRTPRKATGRKSAPQIDYGVPVRQLGQLVGTACLMRGQRADALTVGMFTGPLADATNRLAHEVPSIARVCEYLMTVGPYGEFLTVAVALGMQLAANHGMIKPGEFGTLTERDLIIRTVGDSV
jgi:hypothetical protein